MIIYIVELLNDNEDDYNYVSTHQDFKEAVAKAKRLGAAVSKWETYNHRIRYVTMYRFNKKGELKECS